MEQSMPDSGSLDGGSIAASERVRIRRHPERAHYDRETVYAILDAALMCHVGYVIDGLPYVTPTLFWREGERLYWHGSSASRMLRAQREGIPVCLTVSHIDGLVLARCAFRHSLNYRAVMAFGTAEAVEDEREKEAGLNALIERLYPGRTGLMRPIAAQELKATMLLRMAIEEVSAKIRDEGPLDLEADHMAECWAGVIPIATRLGTPIPDRRVPVRRSREREIGHLAEGARFDAVLRRLAESR
jgi:nitroimidazol reductase NimA-like FMN-containing flavoprotein (pyridoxamine 5'-phosphate oxidase superfamily)